MLYATGAANLTGSCLKKRTRKTISGHHSKPSAHIIAMAKKFRIT